MPQPKILALDTSTTVCSVSLQIDTKVFERRQPHAQRHGQVLLTMIDSLLTEAGLQLVELDAIAFGSGPGSFTGLRVGVGVVQGLATAATLPVIAVSSLQAMALGVIESYNHNKALVVVDARMQQFYWALYQRMEKGNIDTIIADSIGKLADITVPGTGWLGVGNGWEMAAKEFSARLALKVTKIVADCYPRAPYIGKIAAQKFLHGEWLEPEKALPTYLTTGNYKTGVKSG